MPHLHPDLGLPCKLHPERFWLKTNCLLSEYDFYNFNTIGGKGNLIVTLYLSVSLNAGSLDNPLAYGIQLDGGSATKVVPVGTSPPGGLPTGWGGNDGWVANNAILSATTFQSVQPGKHTLRITAVEPALVIQKIVISTLLFCAALDFLDTKSWNRCWWPETQLPRTSRERHCLNTNMATAFVVVPWNCDIYWHNPRVDHNN